MQVDIISIVISMIIYLNLGFSATHAFASRVPITFSLTLVVHLCLLYFMYFHAQRYASCQMLACWWHHLLHFHAQGYASCCMLACWLHQLMLQPCIRVVLPHVISLTQMGEAHCGVFHVECQHHLVCSVSPYQGEVHVPGHARLVLPASILLHASQQSDLSNE